MNNLIVDRWIFENGNVTPAAAVYEVVAGANHQNVVAACADHMIVAVPGEDKRAFFRREQIICAQHGTGIIGCEDKVIDLICF